MSDHAVTWMDAYGKFSRDERTELIVVRDTFGTEHHVPVPNAELFIEMIQGGGGHPDNWYATRINGIVRQGAFLSVRHATPGDIVRADLLALRA